MLLIKYSLQTMMPEDEASDQCSKCRADSETPDFTPPSSYFGLHIVLSAS